MEEIFFAIMISVTDPACALTYMDLVVRYVTLTPVERLAIVSLMCNTCAVQSGLVVRSFVTSVLTVASFICN